MKEIAPVGLDIANSKPIHLAVVWIPSYYNSAAISSKLSTSSLSIDFPERASSMAAVEAPVFLFRLNLEATDQIFA